MIDFSVQKTGLEHNIQKARENNIIICAANWLRRFRTD